MTHRLVATVILQHFEDFHREFNRLTSLAPALFVGRDWSAIQTLSKDRLELHPSVVDEAVMDIESLLPPEMRLSANDWAEIKREFAECIQSRRDAPMAETFFNSVAVKVFGSDFDLGLVGFTNPQRRVLLTTPPEPVYERFYLGKDDLHSVLWRMFRSFRFEFECEDIMRDLQVLAKGFGEHLMQRFGSLIVDHVDLIKSVFYRNKGAYIIGRIVKGNLQVPFLIPLVHSDRGVSIDGLLMSKDDIAIVFSFTRSYFFVATPSPVDLILFLRPMMSHKNLSELYASIGYDRHAKTVLYKEIYRHLNRTQDKFVLAPGIKGMVMVVFTLPGFNVVFKVIRDRFKPPKNVSRQHVIDCYRLVLRHDRVGRLADAQEFTHLRFDKSRFSKEALDELRSSCGESLQIADDVVLIRHLFTERKMTPLNLYLEAVDQEKAEKVVIDYGYAVKELAAANIFPGDLLLKNFGVTRHGRVVFYDYDELCFLHEVNFRKIPEPRNPEQAMSGEPWYSVAENDVFPEEFRSFMVPAGHLRQVFLHHHSDLFDVKFWREMQALHANGVLADLYPYRRGLTLGFSIV